MPVATGRRSSRAAKAHVGSYPRSSSCGSLQCDSSGSTAFSSNTSSFSSSSSVFSALSKRKEAPFCRRSEGACPDMCGPFTVEIVADASRRSRSTLYTLRIEGTDGMHFVLRRYTWFAELSEALDRQGEWLPRMPPKSVFLRHVSPLFRKERVRGLGWLLAATVHADPFAADPWLRGFLGLSKVQPREGEGLSRVSPGVLSLIAEAENESRGSSYALSYGAHGSTFRLSYGAHDPTASASWLEVIHDESPGARVGLRHACSTQASSGRAVPKVYMEGY